MIGSDNIRKGPDRTWAPRGIGHAVTFRCWRCDKTRSTQGAKLIGKLKLKVCAECSNVRAKQRPEHHDAAIADSLGPSA